MICFSMQISFMLQYALFVKTTSTVFTVEGGMLFECAPSIQRPFSQLLSLLPPTPSTVTHIISGQEAGGRGAASHC